MNEMDEESKEAVAHVKEAISAALKAKGQEPTDRNIVKLAYTLWLADPEKGVPHFTAMLESMVALTTNITGCDSKAFHVDEACEILAEVFLDLAFQQKKAGLSRGPSKKPVLGYLLQNVH